MNQTLILIRGLPGSGKTTLSKSIRPFDLTIKRFEADDYFTNSEGEYHFNPSNLEIAHSECQCRTRDALVSGYTVIVSNTFTQLWEMKEYKIMVRELNIPLQIIECKGIFENIHNVPMEQMRAMRIRWENLSV